MSVIRELDLDKLILKQGKHAPDHTFCVEEAVAYIAGEEWTDEPACVSPVIRMFLIGLNDSLGEKDRQALKQLILPQLGSAGGKKREAKRELMLWNWTIRVAIPEWLESGQLTPRSGKSSESRRDNR